MTTPQQFLESFLREKTAIYAEANTRLSPVYMNYLGEPLSQHTAEFLLQDKPEITFDDVSQNADSAVVTTRQHFRSRDIRRRYHLAALGENWKIVRIDWECFCCNGTGRSGDSRCQKCNGEGWYEPRRNVT